MVKLFVDLRSIMRIRSQAPYGSTVVGQTNNLYCKLERYYSETSQRIHDTRVNIEILNTYNPPPHPQECNEYQSEYGAPQKTVCRTWFESECNTTYVQAATVR